VFFIAYLQAEFHASGVATLPTYLPTKFHMPSSSGLLVIAIKAKGKIHFASSGSSSPLCLRILKEGSRVRQKHNCLGIVFIAAIVTTSFGRAWPSSGHNVDVVHKREKTRLYVGLVRCCGLSRRSPVWVTFQR
jgi:hypothetical protein